MGIAFGLGAAISWGLADYFAAVASREIGALRVVLGFHLAAMVPLTVLVLTSGSLAHVTAVQLLLFVLVGAIGWVSYLAFYAALAIGPISVLSPIVSGYAAITVLLAVAILGESLTALQMLIIGVTIAGAMIASADAHQMTRAKFDRRSVLGFALALTAMALLGGFVFGVSYYRPQLGWLAPIFLARGFAAAFLLVHVLAAGRPGEAAVWPRKLLGLIVVLAALDTGGYIFFNLGVGEQATAIVAAASAAYAIVPIVMGVSLFGERPSPTQWLGVALVVTGVVTLGSVA